MDFNTNEAKNFKSVIEDIVDSRLQKKALPSFVSAIIVKVNSDNTVNVVIPPDNTKHINNVLNKTGENLKIGDSIELCTKNGKLTNAWVAVKHGKSQIGGGGVSGDTLPIGTIVDYSIDTIPENWLLCDGRAISRTTYADLFDVIGTTYGSGDGSTTFNLPDLRGKVTVGLNSNDTDFNTIGATGGEKTHTLTKAETPKVTGRLQFRQNGSLNIVACYSNLYNDGCFNFTDGGAAQWSSSLDTGGTATNNALVTFNNGGNDEAHNNLQPYQVHTKIIKAFQSAGVVSAVSNTYSDSTTNTYSCQYINEHSTENPTPRIATASLSANITLTNVDVPLDTIESTTDSLTLQSNGIRIGAGISKVKVSGNMFCYSASTSVTYSWTYITKNGIDVSIAIASASGRYCSTSHSPRLISVQEGDIIKLHKQASTQSDSIRGTSNTWLTVEVVE